MTTWREQIPEPPEGYEAAWADTSEKADLFLVGKQWIPSPGFESVGLLARKIPPKQSLAISRAAELIHKEGEIQRLKSRVAYLEAQLDRRNET